MPLTLKTGAFKYRKTDGTYQGINAIASETVAQEIAAIQNTGAAQVAAVNQKGLDTLASIPDDYTTLANSISQLSEDIDNLENGVNVYVKKAQANSRWPRTYLPVQNEHYYSIRVISVIGESGYDNIGVSAGSTSILSGMKIGVTYGFSVASNADTYFLFNRYPSAPSDTPVFVYELTDLNSTAVDTLLGLKTVDFHRVDTKAVSNAGAITSNSNWGYAEYTLNGETEIYFTGYGNRDYNAILFYNSNGIIDVSQYGAFTGSIFPAKINVPEGAVKVIVNGRKTDPWYSGIFVASLKSVNEQIMDIGELVEKCFTRYTNLTSDQDLDDVWEMGTYVKSTSQIDVGHWPFPVNHGGRVNVYSHLTNSNMYSYVQVAFDVNDQRMAFRINNNTWQQWQYVSSGGRIPASAKVAVIGDSISTYSGYSESSPDTVQIGGVTYPYREAYYPNGTVNSVDKTWWYSLCKKAGVSDITVSAVSRCYFRKDQVIDGTDGCPAPWHPDRISRVVSAAPDWIFINVGVNDLFGWDNTRDSAIPGTTVVSELEALAEGTARGLALLICKLRTSLPNAHIVGIIPKAVKNSSYFYALSCVCQALIATYQQYGIQIIDLRQCGINTFNAVTYSVDSDGIHPNADGMALMAEYIWNNLK